MPTGYRETGIGYREPGLPYRGGEAEPPISSIPVTGDIYRIVVADLAGNRIAEVPPKNLQFSYTLNGPGSIDFQLPLEHSKADASILDAGKRKLYVEREGVIVWGGYLWFVSASGSEEHIRCSGEGFFSRLRRRTIGATQTFTNADQLDIAWGLINYTQGLTNGNLGFTRSDTTYPSVNRTRKYPYWERANIGQAIEELAILKNGFDFEITPAGVWKTYYPRKGSVLTNLIFDLESNIRGISVEIDASNTSSEITALGGGEGKATCIAVYSDSTSLTEFGLLQDTVSYREIKNYAFLQDKAQEELRLHKGQRFQPQIAIHTGLAPWGLYSIGDEIRLKAVQGFFNINKNFRIISMTVAVADEGNEVITVFFDEELVI